jgi:deazaflavin-dependent oxidoreductase (nitroreductase family)
MSKPQLGPPRGLKRWLARAPLWLYRARLGWLLGRRFLLLIHTGRKSGQRRYAVLEVMRHDPEAQTYYVASGYGPTADWFRNIRADPEVILSVGSRRTRAWAEPLPPQQAAAELAGYARRHPVAFRNIARVLGIPAPQTADGFATLADLLPIVALRTGM